MVETDNGVANKEARSLGSTVLVDAYGAFVAVLRNRAEIVRARPDGEFPNSAARPFPVGSHAADAVTVVFLRRGTVHLF